MSRNVSRAPPAQEDQRPTPSRDILYIKRKRETDENMSENSADRNKRANFSAISSNGLNRNLNILNLKPTATKKLVIKNLKSKFICFCLIRLSMLSF